MGAPPCPPDLPAHGHADALAYEAVIRGVRVVASAGTAAYGEGPERDRDRRPGAFAGALVDGGPPADPYGAFRVGARGWVRRLEAGERSSWPFATAAAGGFGGAPGVVHRRTVAVSPRGSVAAVDEWTGRGARSIDSFLPLAPGLVAAPSGDGAVVRGAGGAWRLIAPGARVTVEEGAYALAMGTAVPRSVLRLSWRGGLPVRLVHAWTVGEHDASLSAEPRVGDEIRIDLARGEDVETGWVPAGQPA